MLCRSRQRFEGVVSIEAVFSTCFGYIARSTNNRYNAKGHFIIKYAALIGWLKQSRIDQGLSMRALAEILGKPHSFVQKVEMMERRLDVYEYSIYCTGLGVDPRKGIDLLSES